MCFLVGKHQTKGLRDPSYTTGPSTPLASHVRPPMKLAMRQHPRNLSMEAAVRVRKSAENELPIIIIIILISIIIRIHNNNNNKNNNNNNNNNSNSHNNRNE